MAEYLIRTHRCPSEFRRRCVERDFRTKEHRIVRHVPIWDEKEDYLMTRPDDLSRQNTGLLVPAQQASSQNPHARNKGILAAGNSGPHRA